MKTYNLILIIIIAFAAGYAVGTGHASGYCVEQESIQTPPAASIEQPEALCDTDTDCIEKFGGEI